METARLVGTAALTHEADPVAPPASSEVRWGGMALALSALTFVVTIVLYAAVYGQPTGTGEGGDVTLQDAATHLVDRWWFISKVWMVEAVGMVVLAIGAFALQRRTVPGAKWFPARVAWSAVGIGALLQAVMYAFMLGGYPEATAEPEGSLGLYAVMRGGATFLFYLGNAALYFGLGGVFFSETSPAGLLPRWLAYVGAAFAFVTALLMIGLIAGVGDMLLAAPGAMVGFLLAAYLGILIWRRG